MDMAETTDSGPDLSGLADADPAQLAAMVGQVSDEQLAEGMADPKGRKLILDEIFKRMGEHVDPAAIADLEAIIHFQITDAPDGGHDVYEAIFKDGTVVVSDTPAGGDPKVTIIAAPVPFLKLVTGQDSGPAMFMTGKLKIKGDLMFASRMTSFFRIPSSG
jgi:putative sterol carrier protein